MDYPAGSPEYSADTPSQTPPGPYDGWPANELEETLAASLGVRTAGARIVEVLGRSRVWVPLPAGRGAGGAPLDLPAMEIEGQAYVPVFSSEGQLRRVAGAHTSFAVAPAVEFARGLPPQVGVVVNPEGAVGLPLPPPAVAELCRVGRDPLDGEARGGRVTLSEPDWRDDPVAFLGAACAEFDAVGGVRTARRCLASVEAGEPVLFVGVEVSDVVGDAHALPREALGRALAAAPPPWPVHLVLLDAADDPVCDWMRERTGPFYRRDS
ncbi:MULTISPECIES: enhanced serine sensitivity protein SseB [unclassified Streptomyces]|uniref:enhanced serine sensitivity protein SseB n=1 Tax=unclassified Streptomyces TaxID=2593676 RepID=UPI0019040D4C|nr:enhanced serine sensitivity protein SseB [Streptomyces sp. HSG2]